MPYPGEYATVWQSEPDGYPDYIDPDAHTMADELGIVAERWEAVTSTARARAQQGDMPRSYLSNSVTIPVAEFYFMWMGGQTKTICNTIRFNKMHEIAYIYDLGARFHFRAWTSENEREKDLMMMHHIGTYCRCMDLPHVADTEPRALNPDAVRALLYASYQDKI